jgi:hypothetical protein
MPKFLLIAKAEYAASSSVSRTSFEDTIEAISADEAVRLFWANTAVILTRHGLPLNTTRISLSVTEILDRPK